MGNHLNLSRYASRHFFREKSFPELCYERWGECDRFSKSVSEEVRLLLDVVKVHHWGLGKAFLLETGVEILSSRFPEPIIVRRNAFTLCRSFDRPCWTYATESELEEALESMAGLTHTLLPIFEKACAEQMVPIAGELPKHIEVRGAMTARQGLEQARNVALEWATDAALIQVTLRANMEIPNVLRFGPSLGPDGRLKPHGIWAFLFSSSVGRCLRVDAPYFGPLGSGSFDTPVTFTFLPLGEDWIDSNKVISRAESNAQRNLEDATSDIRLGLLSGLTLEYDKTRYGIDCPIWRVSFSTLDTTRNHRSFLLTLRAIDKTEDH